MDVVALAGEAAVRADLDLDQQVARRPSPDPGTALAPQAEHLPIARSGRHRDVQGRAVRQGQPLGRAVDRLQEVQRQPATQVPAAHPHAAGVAAGTGTAEKPGQQVVRIRQVREAGVARVSMRPGVGLPGEVAVEMRPLRPLGARGVDLAAVEARALVGVPEQVVGRRYPLEPLLGRAVARVEVRVQLPGQTAIGAADLLRAALLES